MRCCRQNDVIAVSQANKIKQAMNFNAVTQADKIENAMTLNARRRNEKVESSQSSANQQ